MVKRLYLLAVMCLMGTLLLPVRADARIFIFTTWMHSMQAQFDDIANEVNQMAVNHAISYDCYVVADSLFPCWLSDDDDFFTASGFFRYKDSEGESTFAIRLNEQLKLLRLQIRMKIGGTVSISRCACPACQRTGQRTGSRKKACTQHSARNRHC